MLDFTIYSKQLEKLIKQKEAFENISIEDAKNIDGSFNVEYMKVIRNISYMASILCQIYDESLMDYR